MTTIKEAVEDLFNNPQLSVQEVVDRHYIPAFRQRTNGSWDGESMTHFKTHRGGKCARAL
jgi:hypothetical protein